MGDVSPAVLCTSAPQFGRSHIRREPAWAYYSQVSVAGPSGHAAEHRTEVHSGRATLTKSAEVLPATRTVVVQRSIHETQHEDGPWSLTQRELDVLQLLAEGATNSEISERLFISPKTTKNHLAAIFQKLDVTNRTHALVRAVVMGLVTIE
jgi:DNA-binding NarL/FixJ family response regulator